MVYLLNQVGVGGGLYWWNGGRFVFVTGWGVWVSRSVRQRRSSLGVGDWLRWRAS